MAEKVALEQQPEQSDSQLHMFFGMLNLPKLAKILPFPPELDTHEDRLADLEGKAVALTCHGHTRVFASRHASLFAQEGGKVETFGVRLTPEQAAFTDKFEDLDSNYYVKVEVDVLLHPRDRESEPAKALVYQMSERAMAAEIEVGKEHSNDGYVKECATSDVMHLKLRGLELPTEVKVPVTNIGDLRVLRVVTAVVDELDGSAYDKTVLSLYDSD